MEKETLLQKIRSVKYCLMAHPHNEPDSEFADRIDDLQEIEDSLESPPPIQSIKKLDAIRLYLKNNIGEMVAYENNMDAVSWGYQNGIIISGNDAQLIVDLIERGAEHQARQQPVPETIELNINDFCVNMNDVERAFGAGILMSGISMENLANLDLIEMFENFKRQFLDDKGYDPVQQPVRKTLDEPELWQQVFELNQASYVTNDPLEHEVMKAKAIAELLQTKAVEPQ